LSNTGAPLPLNGDDSPAETAGANGGAAKGEAKRGVPERLDPEPVADVVGGIPAGAVARRGPPKGESDGPTSEKGEGAGACIA
jgi:hypothetical protein